jgi:hypothetical protein
MDQAPMACKPCGCHHHKFVPLLIALIGLDFLLRTLGVLSIYSSDIIWSILLIIIGLQKLMGHMCKCCGGMGCMPKM